MTSYEIARTLDRLIQTNKDAQAGFHTAMDAVEDDSLRHLFWAISQQRGSFADDLRQLVESVAGEEPRGGTTIGGAVHRGWMNLRAAMTDGSSGGILAECERGEDAAVRNYEEALEQNLPTEVRTVVQSQHRCVTESHDQIRDLRDTARAH